MPRTENFIIEKKVPLQYKSQHLLKNPIEASKEQHKISTEPNGSSQGGNEL